MVRVSLILLIVSGGVTSAHADDEIGTCLSVGGVWLGPWTDPVDPACGDDCAEDPVGGLCEGPDGCLTRVDAAPKMPEPRGPRCLESGDECGPAPIGGAPSATSLLLAVGASWTLEPPRLGLLPGASVLPFVARAYAYTSPPPTRPPRLA